MRLYADNGGMQQTQLLIPNYPNNREAQSQTHLAQSVYADASANNSAEEFNGNITSIDIEVVGNISCDILLLFSIKFFASFDRIPFPIKTQNYTAVYATLPGQLVDAKSNLAIEIN